MPRWSRIEIEDAYNPHTMGVTTGAWINAERELRQGEKTSAEA